MTVRLLVHGGNAHAERRRIGVWPDILAGTLEDRYGLTPATHAYGLGRHQGGTFAIWRRTMAAEERTYALSVLLDPGDDVWERFGWNAPALLEAARQGSPSLMDEIEQRPEHLTEDAFERAISGLLPVPGAEERSPGGSRLAALVLAPLVIERPLTFSPLVLSPAGIPTLDEAARLLHAYPPVLITGAGWLIRGAQVHGEQLGARLVIDGEAPSSGDEASVLEPAIRAVETLLSAPTHLMAVDLPELEKLLAAPAWTVGSEIASATRRLELLAIDAEALSDDAVGELVQELRREGPFRGSLQALEDRTVLAIPSVTVGSHRERALVRRVLDGGSEEAANRLAGAGDAAVGEMLAAGRDARRQAHYAMLPARLRLRALERLIESGDEDVMQLVGEGEAIELPDDGTDWAESLASKAIEASLGGSLAPFVGCQRESPVGAAILRMARLEVRKAARRVHAAWPLEYALLAEDLGGEELADGVSPADATKLAHELGKALPSSHDEELLAWLRAAGRGGLRAQIDSIVQEELADEMGLPWSAFRHARRLLDGRSGDAPPPDRSGLEAAIQEQLAVDVLKHLAGTPDLRGLYEWMGPLPSRILDALALKKPALADPSAADAWIEGWRLVGRASKADEERARQAAGGQRPFEHVEVAGPNLVASLRGALMQGSPENDADCVRLVDHLLAAAPPPQWRDAIRQLSPHLRHPKNFDVFARRFLAYRPTLKTLDRIVECTQLNEFDPILAQFETAHPYAFDALAAETLSVIRNGGEVGVLHRRLARHACSHPTTTLDRLKATLVGHGTGEDLRQLLGDLVPGRDEVLR
jgi:hypothetical protein